MLVDIRKKILEKEQKNQQELEAMVENLEEEIEILKEALDRSLEFLSVDEFNSLYKKDWSEEECKKAEKEMTIYCLTDCIRIKERERENPLRVEKLFPKTAWEFLHMLD